MIWEELCFDPSLSRNKAQRLLTQMLIAAGVESAALDARLILCAALGVDHAALVRDPDQPIGISAEKMAALASRRLVREPLSRILGRREFCGLDFVLNPAVLDPRPDTEILIEAVLGALAMRRDDPLRILDLGTGTGAILAALLMRLPQTFGIGIDISEAACRVARSNLESLGLAPRSAVLCGDWARSLRGAFDAIVANPPYVARGVIQTLAPEVRDHDPVLALDGGEDGLAAYREIIPSLADLLAPDAIVALEIGAGQAFDSARILDSNGFANIGMHCDLAGHERVVMARCIPGLNV